jgi:hypothetical protein
MKELRHGYHHGERVRDTRDGTLGRVRFLELTPDEITEGGYADAEIVWDGHFSQTELDLVRAHLERVLSEPDTSGNTVNR